MTVTRESQRGARSRQTAASRALRSVTGDDELR